MQTIQSKLLNQFKNLTQCFTTKKMGNIAFHVNDKKIQVIQNHKTLAKHLSYNVESLVHMKQIHSCEVREVQECDNFSTIPSCDALITDKKNIPLMVMVADCAPVLFYDAQKKVIAVAHAGRAGAFGNIIGATLQSFSSKFNSNISDIYVSIGASIGVCCYEVGEEINTEANAIGLGYAISKQKNTYHLDISKILYRQLIDAGIEKEHIEISQECTSCNREKYFSYRAEKETGRFCGVIMIG